MNFTKTIINAIQNWTTNKLNKKVDKEDFIALKNTKIDWNQNDETADDYIKNRPFYTDENGKVKKINKEYLPDLGLADVATSGNYNDLSNKPTIYTDVVRYNSTQSLSTMQKTQARNNISAASTEDVADIVKYDTTQNLTDLQKTQARENIGAGTSNFDGDYNSLINTPIISQANWNTHDVDDASYIQGRTHYEKSDRIEFYSHDLNLSFRDATDVSGELFYAGVSYPSDNNIERILEYVRQGLEIECNIEITTPSQDTICIKEVPKLYSISQGYKFDYYVLGNQYLLNNVTSPPYYMNLGSDEDDGGTVAIVITDCHEDDGSDKTDYWTWHIFTTNVFSGSPIMTLSNETLYIKQLDAKYIPDTIARTSGVEEKIATINEMPETSESYMQLVTDADGKAMWEEKLAYITEAELIPETELTTKQMGSGSMQSIVVEFTLDEPIDYGETMVVYVDGQRYEGLVIDRSTAESLHPDGFGIGGAILGDYNVDTELKPAYTAKGMNEDQTWGLRSADGQTWYICAMYYGADYGWTMRVSVHGASVKTIEPKYLPKPYVIKIENGDEGFMTTASVEDAIDAYKTGREVVFEVDGYPRISANGYYEDNYTKEIGGQLLIDYGFGVNVLNVGAADYSDSSETSVYFEEKGYDPCVIHINDDGTGELSTDASVENAFAAHKAGREVVFVYGTERMIATQFIDNNVFKLIGGNTTIDDGVSRNFVSFAVLQSGNMTQVYHENANLMEALTLDSPNGTRYRLTVADDGTWSYVSEGGQDDSPAEKLVKSSDLVPSDWTQTDENAIDYIKNKPYEETSDDALDLLAEMGVLEATTNEEGFILTDENNNILTI